VCRLGAAVPHGFHARGLHATSVCGVFAAALIASKLMGLDAPVKYDLLMSEARRMAETLGMQDNEFMTLCEQVAAEAWGGKS